jgi:ABC-type nitrate/sulfonate/bicarbonate transport system substrate-binding protein
MWEKRGSPQMKQKVTCSCLLISLAIFSLADLSYGQTKDMKKIRLNVFRIDAATVAARVHGYFAAEGLDVEITATPNSTDQMRGVSQGKFEIASTAFDNVLAWSGREGAEIVAVAQISDKTVLPVFVRPEIKTWSDLKGKKLAADAVDTAFALVLRRILLANGLDMTRGDYELAALGTRAAARIDDQRRNLCRDSQPSV